MPMESERKSPEGLFLSPIMGLRVTDSRSRAGHRRGSPVRAPISMVMPDVVAEEIAAEVVGAVPPDGVDVVAVVLDVGDFH